MALALAPEEPSDEQLLERIMQGHREAFDTLVRRHAVRFYRVAYRFLNHREDAEDMVQDAFLKLWREPERWDSRRNTRFTTWFHTLVVNQCLDEKRRKKPMPMHEDADYTDTAPLADEQLEHAERQQRVERAFQALPEAHKTALNLSFYEGIPNKDAATIMGMQLKAFQSLLMRAKVALKEKVTAHEAEPRKGKAHAAR